MIRFFIGLHQEILMCTVHMIVLVLSDIV